MLYLGLEYLSGGDLRYHIGIQRSFNEEQTQFFIAKMASRDDDMGWNSYHLLKVIHLNGHLSPDDNAEDVGKLI